MTKIQKEDRFTDKETRQRFEATLRAALNSPPKPMKSLASKKPIGQPKKKGR